ncbi:MAG: Sec-independent protein translocase protein TatB [Oceanospirillaceae bacterium]
MFDIGFTELLLIAVVALVVLGPEKLPVAIRTLGLWIGKAKRTISGIQTEISEELKLDEMKRTASIAKEQLNSELEEMKSPFMSEAATKQTVDQSDITASKDEVINSGENDTTGQAMTSSQVSESNPMTESVPTNNIAPDIDKN